MNSQPEHEKEEEEKKEEDEKEEKEERKGRGGEGKKTGEGWKRDVAMLMSRSCFL